MISEASRGSKRCIGDIIGFLEELAPLRLAESWDNVGLLLGDRAAAVERIMTCLSVTLPVAAEAIQERVSLIVSHHPIFFRPVQQIVADHPEGRMLLDLIRANLAVYSPHTAYDNAARGINQQLAELLDLEEITPLRPFAQNDATTTRNYKLIVFVPEAHWERVAQAMFDAGAGQIGEYAQCSFRAAGTGTFFGSEASHPAIGQKGRREEVAEFRLEVLCPQDRLSPVLAALRRAHPYEEPACDVYPLGHESRIGSSASISQPPQAPATRGAGRKGRLASPITVGELIERIKDVLKVAHVGLVGQPQRIIATLAVACGSGGDFLADAIQAGCDAFLTGEARFHAFLEADAHGIALLLPGHYATERFAIERLAAMLAERFPESKVSPSHAECNPLAWR